MSKHFRHVRKTTVIKDPQGQHIKVGGYRPDKHSSKDKKYGSNRNFKKLPPQVDLRPYMTPVENQGDSNSCTANALAGAYEYLTNRLRGKAEDVSRLFIYYNARDLDGAVESDEGTYLRSCIQVLQKYGACTERTWPFNLRQIFDPPHDEAYDEAANFLIEEAYRLDADLDQMRGCLAEGYPFAFGLELFSSFQKAGATGLVPMPNPEKEQHDGGHAMLCVGYSDADKVFIVRNSWGKKWGDRGYCYIPYDYMTNPELNDDLWTIRRVSEPVDLSEGIQGTYMSLFSPEMAAIASALQTLGAAGLITGFQDPYPITYEEQYVYLEDTGFVSVDEVENLDELYEQEYEEEYEDDEEYEEEGEEEEYDEEEAVDSYDEEDYEEDDELDEEEDEQEEYDEEEDEEYVEDEDEEEDEEYVEDEDEEEDEEYVEDEDEEYEDEEYDEEEEDEEYIDDDEEEEDVDEEYEDENVEEEEEEY